MHMDIKVAELEIDELTGNIRKVGRVFTPDHLPLGITVKNGKADRAALNSWWADRSIPLSRSGIREAMETIEISDTKQLLLTSMQQEVSRLCRRRDELRKSMRQITNIYSNI